MIMVVGVGFAHDNKMMKKKSILRKKCPLKDASSFIALNT